MENPYKKAEKINRRIQEDLNLSVFEDIEGFTFEEKVNALNYLRSIQTDVAILTMTIMKGAISDE